MDSSLRQLRTIQIALLVSILIYLLVSLHAPARSKGIPLMILFLALLAGAMAIAVFVVRSRLLTPSEAVVAQQPEDKGALSRWRTAYILMWALCEAIAAYGLVLRYLGFTLAQAAPFFACGFILILAVPPRRPEQVG
jgi:hypothetical protein